MTAQIKTHTVALSKVQDLVASDFIIGACGHGRVEVIDARALNGGDGPTWQVEVRAESSQIISLFLRGDALVAQEVWS